MRTTLVIHIIAGAIGLMSGFLALYSVKGMPLHRKAGMVFVVSMITMSTAGFIVTVVRGVAPAINIPASLVTAALIVTSFTTVRPLTTLTQSLDRIAMIILLGVGLTDLLWGFEAIANGGMRNGVPAFPFMMFGTIGTLAGIGDVRIAFGRKLEGALKVARHLWRMSFALLIAALSFFIGQADEIPEPYRIMPLLGLPVLLVLVTMLYWLWRVRFKRSLRGLSLRTLASRRSDP